MCPNRTRLPRRSTPLDPGCWHCSSSSCAGRQSSRSSSRFASRNERATVTHLTNYTHVFSKHSAATITITTTATTTTTTISMQTTRGKIFRQRPRKSFLHFLFFVAVPGGSTSSSNVIPFDSQRGGPRMDHL